ncbi:hypothetical protein ACRQ5Q_35895 [Bradyrhizobium sp. PMVTL-01]|uniref:hypothetical protein n=1 Tax=unclassified Bradyrhizobium TaxID=2631580 RepID=UPI003F70573E
MYKTYVPALAAFGGSTVGVVSTLLTGWVTKRRKSQWRRHAHAFSAREKLYRSFIEEASRLYADALTTDKSEISQFVHLYALVGRMRMVSNDEVVLAAEKAGRLILETYTSPNRSLVDLPKLIDDVDPLREFSQACRRELQAVPSR